MRSFWNRQLAFLRRVRVYYSDCSSVTAGENIRPAAAPQWSCGRVLVAKEVIQ
jgi:hypothetical protein